MKKKLKKEIKELFQKISKDDILGELAKNYYNLNDDMDKLTYKCKQNDNIIEVRYENGKIYELLFKTEIDKGWTVIGYQDLIDVLTIANELVNNDEN